MNKFLKGLLLFFAPLALILLEIWHPYGFQDDVYHRLAPQIEWWITLHIAQSFLFPLAAAGVYLLIKGSRGFDATMARCFLLLFAIAYTVYDAVAGIGLGNLILQGRGLAPDKIKVLEEITQKYFSDPWFGGMGSWLSQFASWTWILTVIFTVIVLYRMGKPFLPLILLLMSGVYLWMSHAYPNGPIAFACLLAANLGFVCCSKRDS